MCLALHSQSKLKSVGFTSENLVLREVRLPPGRGCHSTQRPPSGAEVVTEPRAGGWSEESPRGLRVAGRGEWPRLSWSLGPGAPRGCFSAALPSPLSLPSRLAGPLCPRVCSELVLMAVGLEPQSCRVSDEDLVPSRGGRAASE